MRALEVALAVAIQKDEAALADLKDERAAAVETEAAACARLAALGPRGEELLTAVKQFSTDMALATDALRVAGGNERYAYSVNEIKGQFEVFLGIAKRSFYGTTTSKTYMKYETWSDARGGLRHEDTRVRGR